MAPGTEEPGSERDPLGRSRTPSARRRIEESSARPSTGQPNLTKRCAQGRCKPGVQRRMRGAGLSDGCTGKALSDMPAIQPYRGKPAVRKDRGDGGNVGILRSPLRATVLPDCGGRSAMVVPTATLDASSASRLATDTSAALKNGPADYLGGFST